MKTGPNPDEDHDKYGISKQPISPGTEYGEYGARNHHTLVPGAGHPDVMELARGQAFAYQPRF